MADLCVEMISPDGTTSAIDAAMRRTVEAAISVNPYTHPAQSFYF